MKLLVVLAVSVALCAGKGIPDIPGDNSHYVEGESRYIWMADGEGVPQLVDLQAPVDQQVLRSIERNGANNAYWLFTRSNPTTAQVIVYGDANSLSNSNYVASRPLKVIVHGWNNNGNTEMNPLITAAFLSVMDCNVIVVDWSSVANGAYTTAVAAVPSVGQYIGYFVDWVINNAGGNWNNVHLVGFSLGAHIVGNAGRTAGGRAARVTGLDPAGPSWGNNALALTTSDGQYVEAIHTDGGFLGIFDPIATANFYPNGGRNPQPGCWLNTCSHGRSTELFAATVQFNHLVGRQCASLAEAQQAACTGASLQMGNSVLSKQGNGLYGLVTGNSWPY